MKLTRASSYALHAVAYMAAQKQQDRPVASHNIAQARGIPERFLLKVLKPLVSASPRVLKSIKGPNGGYQLARPPAEISVLEVIEAVDGPIRGQAPFSDENPNPLNKKLDVMCDQSADLVKKHLEKIKITDLLPAKK